MINSPNNLDQAALTNVMHELDASRLEIRKISDELNKVITPKLDAEKVRVFVPRVVDMLDFWDILFERLRIELNPNGIEIAPKEQCDIHAIFHRTLKHYSSRMKKSQLRWKLHDEKGFVVKAYPSLAILPFILIDNAIKYAPRGSDIQVTLDQQSGTVVVESLGPKIEDSELQTIFERGVRGHNAISLEPGGQGLGLYIAKRICDAHAFRIAAYTDAGSQLLNAVPFATVRFTLTVH